MNSTIMSAVLALALTTPVLAIEGGSDIGSHASKQTITVKPGTNFLIVVASKSHSGCSATTLKASVKYQLAEQKNEYTIEVANKDEEAKQKTLAAVGMQLNAIEKDLVSRLAKPLPYNIFDQLKLKINKTSMVTCMGFFVDTATVLIPVTEDQVGQDVKVSVDDVYAMVITQVHTQE